MLVKILKIVSGEEIIGRHAAEGEPLADIKRVVIHPGAGGQMQITIMPWFAFGNNYLLDTEWIDKFGMIMVDAPKQLEDAYLQSITGIQLSSSLLTQ